MKVTQILLPRVLFSFLIFLSIQTANAQNFSWAYSIYSTSPVAEQKANDVAIDQNGDVYSTGTFQGYNIDFDHDPNYSALLSSSYTSSNYWTDGFVKKVDSYGNFLWATKVSLSNYGDESMAIAVDANGNSYVTGETDSRLFVSKLSPSGAILWNRQFYANPALGLSIVAGDSGDVYVTGKFNSTVDFDPGPGTYNLTTFQTTSPDVFILKLTTNGQFLWAKSIGGNNDDLGYEIILTPVGNLLIAGTFKNIMDADPGPGVVTFTGGPDDNSFLLSLDTAGNFLWAKLVGSPAGYERIYSLACDVSGNIFTGGSFSGSGNDFDPDTSNVESLPVIGGNDCFVAKYDSLGNFIWAKGFGSSYGASTYFHEGVMDLALDTAFNVYSTGAFSCFVDFDPGPGTANLNGNGCTYGDVFIHKLDSSGNFVWVRKVGGTGTDYGTGIAVSESRDVYVSGAFQYSADFNPGPGTYNMSSGSHNPFVLALNCTSTSTSSVTVCDSLISPSGLYVWKQSGSYIDTLVNVSGCDSLISVVLTIGSSDTTIYISNCDSLISPDGQATWFNSGVYLDTIPSSFGCDSIITIHYTNLSSTSNLQVNSCDFYFSPGGQMLTSSGTYFETITNAAGCDSSITILLTIKSSTYDTITVTTCDSFYSPAGNYYTTSGTFNDTLINTAGCDSVVTIFLNLSQTTFDTISVSACDSFVSPGGSLFYTSSIFNDTIPNIGGCDSIITITLNIYHSIYDTLTTAACDSFIAPSGSVHFSGGTFNDSLVSTMGCDSIITINLTLNHSTLANHQINTCRNFTLPGSGIVVTTSGIYKDTLVNSIGCDSLLTFDLTIIHIDTGVQQSGSDLTANASGLNYQWLDCQNGFLPLTGANTQSFSPVQNGVYSVEITNGFCIDTSECYTINNVGWKEIHDIGNLLLYPNPTTGTFTLKSTDQSETVTSIIMTDLTGRELSPQLLSKGYHAAFTPGLYHIRIHTNRKVYFKKLLIIQ